MDLAKELAIAESLARQAGHMAISMQPQLRVQQKPAGEGPVSNADLALDVFICTELKKHFPDDQLISEESYQGEAFDSCARRVWFIDPIDGTSNYIIGGSDFVVMIGLVINNQAVLGLIYHPSSDALWSGVLGNKISHKQQPPYIRMVVSRHSRSKKQNLLIDKLMPSQILQASSIGLKAMMILDGLVDFYVCWSMRVKMWDTCAPAAILASHGCMMSFIDGSPLSFSGAIAHPQAIMVANFEPNQALFTTLKAIASN